MNTNKTNTAVSGTRDGGHMEQRPVCLTIGGSDSCAGAGIQADLRVFEALNVHGCSAVTALTAQNPARIIRIEAALLAQLDAELHAIFDYYDVAAVKTGMLVDAEHIAVVATALSLLHNRKPVIVDPVMVSSSGSDLLDAGGRLTMIQALLPMTTLLTPNLDEAAVFLGRNVENPETDSQLLMQQLGCAILLKGGHGKGDELCDVLCETDGNITPFTHPRLGWNESRAHGSGCRLAAAITAYLARGNDLPESTRQAIALCTDA
ncbi:MAG: bifunctional hydroxymethylpyrimidine kinase/phosphomethylpyrimidine kinase [Mariprofundaceae bacterium]